MQLISVLTTLAAFKVAAALPSSIKSAKDLVARDATLGSKLCVGYTQDSGLCQTIDSTRDLTPGYCSAPGLDLKVLPESHSLTYVSTVRLDDSMRGAISSIFPQPHSFCTYYMYVSPT